MTLEADVRAHDEALAGLGLDLWVGAEPTFTRRESQEPWWLFEAEGGDKEAAAEALLRALAPRLDAPAALSRVPGRRYPGEDAPRFAFAARWRRDDPRPAEPVAPAIGDDRDGAPPAADPEHAWLTVTPDPGVVEVNMAPARTLAEFLRMARQVYAAAADAGLSAVRYRYNGEATDSGGGGQLTFGGPTPERSPFFLHPGLLPGLLRTLHRRPSLSFLFASACVGSASQGPRPDEGDPQRFAELCVTLDHVGATPPPDDAEQRRLWLWQSFAPLLVDGSGNSHRSEVNIEKLWNPYYPGRGQLGLVELRALRMPPTPEDLVAVAALFRAVVALGVARPDPAPLRPWGPALHDRFALPSVLARDLDDLLDALAAAGLGLGPALTERLRRPAEPLLTLKLGDATLRLTPAVEFWPLVGDVASQERSGARLVDASTRRLEVTVEGADDPGHLSAHGRPVPLTPGPGGRFLAGLRYRAFAPAPGFLPGLAPHDPLVLAWHRGGERADVRLHGWRPGGGCYDGLPDGAEEARARRDERVVVAVSAPAAPPLAAPAGGALTTDLRRPPLPER